jgi:hypothetical protein
VSINGTTLGINSALKFTHYGAADITIQNGYGTLDTRAGVGHMDRNIKFISGPDNGWGYRVLGYSMLDGNIIRTGNLQLNSV